MVYRNACNAVHVLNLLLTKSTAVRFYPRKLPRCTIKMATYIYFYNAAIGASGGVTYVRWGRKSCPYVSGTVLLYHGITAGSLWSNTGGGANYLCMPHNPQYGAYLAGVQNFSPLYGTEYQTNGGGPIGSFDHNAPCAVCYASTRASLLMIPARMECPTSWTREYIGYLMSTAANRHYRTMYECVDRSPERIPGSAGDSAAAVFYHVEATCSGLPCGPYDTQKELTCAVCTK